MPGTGPNIEPARDRVLTEAQLADLGFALRDPDATAGLVVKPGSVPFPQSPVWNSHVWSVGYTSALAAAIWIGNKGPEQALVDRDGAAIEGAGLPTSMLRRAVTGAQTAMGLTPRPLAPPAFVGITDPPGSVG